MNVFTLSLFPEGLPFKLIEQVSGHPLNFLCGMKFWCSTLRKSMARIPFYVSIQKFVLLACHNMVQIRYAFKQLRPPCILNGFPRECDQPTACSPTPYTCVAEIISHTYSIGSKMRDTYWKELRTKELLTFSLFGIYTSLVIYF